MEAEFVFKYKGQNLTVKVGTHVMSMYREDGSMVINSNVVGDYYDEQRGYLCKTERFVAHRYFTHFCHLV